MTPQDYYILGRLMYEKCPTPKPSWEQLGDVTREVWRKRAEEYANSRQQNPPVQDSES
jgi:hypothetical protein